LIAAITGRSLAIGVSSNLVVLANERDITNLVLENKKCAWTESVSGCNSLGRVAMVRCPQTGGCLGNRKGARTIIIWHIAMGEGEIPLNRVDISAIREVTDPIRDHLAIKLAHLADEDDLTIIFNVEDDRTLSIRLQGESFIVNQARDILGEENE